MRAVIGPNGAGKTTMMDVVTGKTRPDTGQVVFGDDTDLTRLDEPAIAALGIGRKFQKPTVFEIAFGLGQSAARAGRRPHAALYAVRAARAPTSGDRIEDILATIRLADSGTVAPPNCRTVRNNGSKSACCWRRSRDCCCSTSRSPG